MAPKTRKRDADIRAYGQRRRKPVKKADLGVSHFAEDFLGIPAEQQRKWLTTWKSWLDLCSPGWRPVKVLGAGGNGICGLFKREGPSRTRPPHVVVKQATRTAKSQLKNESRLLRRILDASTLGEGGGTQHIVKLYKEYFRDPGAGASTGGIRDFDPSSWIAGGPDPTIDVARIYLEYCPGGDLAAQFGERNRDGRQGLWNEEELWRLLGCLAKGAMVMDSGTELPGLPPGAPPFEPIAHFDMKPTNILIGEHGQPDSPHARLPPFKIADFGMAVPIPRDQEFTSISPNFNTNVRWNDDTEWRATPGWPTPEQMEEHPERQIGRRSNTFGVGMIMFSLMHPHLHLLPPVLHESPREPGTIEYDYSFSIFAATPQIINREPPLYATFNALGRSLLGAPYSKHLIEVVHCCLAYRPSQRISARAVSQNVDIALATIDAINTANGNLGAMQLGRNARDGNITASFPGYTVAERTAIPPENPIRTYILPGGRNARTIRVPYIAGPADNMVFPAPTARRIAKGPPNRRQRIPRGPPTRSGDARPGRPARP